MSEVMDRQPIPREIQKWLHSMDLSYQVHNVQKDLCNGFLFGEILQRTDPNNEEGIDMRMFNTGSNVENRISNWENIRKVCKRKSKRAPYYTIFTDAVIDKIIHKAPNVAFQALVSLYTMKTCKKKEDVYIIRDVDEKDKFKKHDSNIERYKWPTAMTIIADKELQRVKDFKTRREMAKQALLDHKRYMAEERERFRIADFKEIKERNRRMQLSNNNFNSYQVGSKGNFYNSNTSNINEVYTSRDRKKDDTVSKNNEKSLDNQKDKKEEKQNLMTIINKDYQGVNLLSTNFFQSNFNFSGAINSNLLKQERVMYEGEEIVWKYKPKQISQDYGVEAKFGDLIKKNFIEIDHNIELEFKKYSDDRDFKDKEKVKDYTGFFFNRFSLALIKDGPDRPDVSDDGDEYPKLSAIFNVFKMRVSNLDTASQNQGKIIDENQYLEEESQEVIKFIEKISKTLLEIQTFLEIFTTFFSLLYQNNIQIDRILDPVIRICNGVKEKDPRRCETIFLGYGLGTLLRFVSEKPFFRNDVLSIISALITNDKYSHLKVLESIKSKFINDEVNYFHIVSKWMDFTTQGMFDTDLNIYYYRICKRGIKSSCSIIKCKSVKMIITFMKYVNFPLEFKDEIFSLRSSFNWEVLAQILMYCTYFLKRINDFKAKYNYEGNKLKISASGMNEEMEEMLHKDENSIQMNVSDHKTDKIESNIKGGGHTKLPKEIMDNISEISEKNNYSYESNILQIKNPKIGETNEKSKIITSKPIIAEAADNSRNMAENMDLDEEQTNFNEILKEEPIFLEVIESIFNTSSPNLTTKVGFLYLAEIIHFYPQLAERYMKLLIEFKYAKVKDQVLSIEHFGKEKEYTSNLYTEKYIFSGAPLTWNQITVAKVFSKYVDPNKIKSLELTHIQIFHSIILNQEFEESEAKEWLGVYNSMKEHLFVSICSKEYSEAGAEIAKKFFDFERIRDQLLDVRLIKLYNFSQDVPQLFHKVDEDNLQRGF